MKMKVKISADGRSARIGESLELIVTDYRQYDDWRQEVLVSSHTTGALEAPGACVPVIAGLERLSVASARAQRLLEFCSEIHTVVFWEAKTLADISHAKKLWAAEDLREDENAPLSRFASPG